MSQKELENEDTKKLHNSEAKDEYRALHPAHFLFSLALSFSSLSPNPSPHSSPRSLSDVHARMKDGERGRPFITKGENTWHTFKPPLVKSSSEVSDLNTCPWLIWLWVCVLPGPLREALSVMAYGETE